MRDRAHILRVLDLIQGDLLGGGVLNVAGATVREFLPHDFELTEDLLNFKQDLLHDFRAAGDLEVVDVLGHNADKLALFMSAAKLGVYLAGNEIALVPSDHAQLDTECQGCVNKPGAGLVAVQHLLGWVEILKPRELLQKGDVGSGQLEIYFVLLLAGELCKLLVSDSLQKGLGNVHRADIPSSENSLAGQNLL